MKTLTEAFNEITVKKGEKFAVELKSNASTGYRWTLGVVSGQATQTAHHHIPDTPPELKVVGGGGTEKFIFKADSEGDLVIGAVYNRPWGRAAPAQKQRFKIKVMP